jgi:hypothetical protein
MRTSSHEKYIFHIFLSYYIFAANTLLYTAIDLSKYTLYNVGHHRELEANGPNKLIEKYLFKLASVVLKQE